MPHPLITCFRGPCASQRREMIDEMEHENVTFSLEKYGTIQDFERSEDFQFFRHQFKSVLQTLYEYVKQHEGHRSAADVKDAFTLLKQRLFHGDFYSTHRELMYGVGKKALDELVELVRNERLPVDILVNNIHEFAFGVRVCADGSVTNMCRIVRGLQLSIGGIRSVLDSKKEEIVDSEVLKFCNSHLGQTAGYLEYQIHHHNAIKNYLADRLGLSVQPDYFAFMSLAVDTVEGFYNTLAPQVTDQALILFLSKRALEEFTSLYLQDTDGHGASSDMRPYDSERAHLAMTHVNQNYSAGLRMTSFLRFSEDLTECEVMTRPTLVVADMLRILDKEQGDTEHEQPTRLFGWRHSTTSELMQVCRYTEDHLWMVRGDEILEITPDEFITLAQQKIAFPEEVMRTIVDDVCGHISAQQLLQIPLDYLKRSSHFLRIIRNLGDEGMQLYLQKEFFDSSRTISQTEWVELLYLLLASIPKHIFTPLLHRVIQHQHASLAEFLKYIIEGIDKKNTTKGDGNTTMDTLRLAYSVMDSLDTHLDGAAWEALDLQQLQVSVPMREYLLLECLLQKGSLQKLKELSPAEFKSYLHYRLFVKRLSVEDLTDYLNYHHLYFFYEGTAEQRQTYINILLAIDTGTEVKQAIIAFLHHYSESISSLFQAQVEIFHRAYTKKIDTLLTTLDMF